MHEKFVGTRTHFLKKDQWDFDIEHWDSVRVEDLRLKIAKEPENLNPIELNFLRNLRIARVFYGNPAELDLLKASISYDRVAKTFVRRFGGAAISSIDDANGALKSGDLATAVLSSRFALELSVKALLAARNCFNWKEKWLYRSLQTVDPERKLTQEFLQNTLVGFEADPKPKIEEVLSLTARLVNAANLERAFYSDEGRKP